jgi:peptidoglycan/LPS O-acetylase OafA/YrhL
MDLWTLCIARPLHLYQDGGHLGVLIFFLVSGFVITHVSTRESAAEFGLRRALRLLPPFWVALGVVIMLVTLCRAMDLPRVIAAQSDDYLASAFFLNWIKGTPAALTVAWTLFIEIIFYVLTGLTIKLARQHPIRATWIIIIIPVIGNMAMMRFPGLIPLMFALMYLPFLCIGRAGYLWWSGISPLPQVICAAIAAYLIFVQVFSNVNPGLLLHAGNEAVVSHAIALIVFFGLCTSGIRSVPKPLSFCADISYSLYLLHAPIGSFLLSVLCGAGLRECPPRPSSCHRRC